jgi:hypothetical protein
VSLEDASCTIAIHGTDPIASENLDGAEDWGEWITQFVGENLQHIALRKVASVKHAHPAPEPVEGSEIVKQGQTGNLVFPRNENGAQFHEAAMWARTP